MIHKITSRNVENVPPRRYLWHATLVCIHVWISRPNTSRSADVRRDAMPPWGTTYALEMVYVERWTGLSSHNEAAGGEGGAYRGYSVASSSEYTPITPTSITFGWTKRIASNSAGGTVLWVKLWRFNVSVAAFAQTLEALKYTRVNFL